MKKYLPQFIMISLIALGAIGYVIVDEWGEDVLGLDLQTEEIREDLLLVKPKEDHVGTKTVNGVVKYAYKTGDKVSDSPSQRVLSRASAEKITVTGEDKSKRTKFAKIFNTNKEDVLIMEVIPDVPQYYEDEKGEWWEVGYATTTVEVYEKNDGTNVLSWFKGLFGQEALADTTTFYPGDGDSMDARFNRSLAPTTWTTCINSAEADSITASDAESNVVYSRSTDSINGGYSCHKSGYTFDLTSIASATITSAEFGVVFTEKRVDDNDGDDYLGISLFTPADYASFVVADFNNFTEALISDDVPDISTDVDVGGSTYTTWDFNATGVTNLQSAVDGTALFGLTVREGHMIEDSAIADNQRNTANGYFSEQTGTSADPKLVIVYTPAPVVSTPPSQISDIIFFQ